MRVLMTDEHRKKLGEAATRDGQDISPWLLMLALRDAEGRGQATWQGIETVRPAPKWKQRGKRERSINIRMTDEQKEKVDRRAAFLGQGLSSWLLLLGLLEAGRAQ